MLVGRLGSDRGWAVALVYYYGTSKCRHTGTHLYMRSGSVTIGTLVVASVPVPGFGTSH